MLVHVYWSLDLNKVYGILQNDIGFLKEFAERVKELLKGISS